MEENSISRSFIEEFIAEDYKAYPVVKTRFPPEPNGYLHIGHVKAMWVDFSMAEKFGGSCNLRFDDTNPVKEDAEFVEAIKKDIHWMGFDWDKLCFGSDYFDTCFELAVKLIKKGVAYVCDLDKDQIREYRGTLTEPGVNSPYRDRSVEENLDLFMRMKAGEFPDGARTLRAKIDMASPNINMRDPALYRILHRAHHQTGDKWCIYPMYDFAHPIQDAIEGVTHSLCSLEYEAHRPLYNWVVEQCEFEHKPRQIEFARLNITNTVLSKRYLRMMVESGAVSGWDDPRMPTLCAMRRRGYPADAIKDFLARAGVAKADSVVDAAMLEHCVRENLNMNAHRAMAVTDPIKLVITNWPEGVTEDIAIENLPVDGAADAGCHSVPFGRELYIERDDFMVEPPRKFFRLKPEGEVRLKGAYIVKCTGYEADETGRVNCVFAEYDPESRSGECTRKVKGTIHWVPADAAIPAEFRIYEPLFDTEEVDADNLLESISPDSITVKHGFVEPFLAGAKPEVPYQFMRVGYFTADPDSREGAPVFNRTVALKDSYKPQGS
ncbi:MAG: glutamine--tRNA ligase/YqeY domain fusion protein [Clostridia bacterium]|nr:glutamine--tRNA ligase/YqeY domain fusion protein [Clostridia bacterium]